MLLITYVNKCDWAHGTHAHAHTHTETCVQINWHLSNHIPIQWQSPTCSKFTSCMLQYITDNEQRTNCSVKISTSTLQLLSESRMQSGELLDTTVLLIFTSFTKLYLSEVREGNGMWKTLCWILWVKSFKSLAKSPVPYPQTNRHTSDISVYCAYICNYLDCTLSTLPVLRKKGTNFFHITSSSLLVSLFRFVALM